MSSLASLTLLGLPGRDPGTFDWMASLFSAVRWSARGDRDTAATAEPTILRYACWNRGPRDPIDFSSEAAKARAVNAPDLIVAKSIGTLVALAAFAGQDPRPLVLIGVPLQLYPPPRLTALTQFATRRPVLFIQQSHDRVGSFAELRAALPDLPTACFAEVPGEDHAYADLAEPAAAIERWWQGI